MSEREITVNVPILARVEGEGALHLRIRGEVIEQLQLQIYEPPRLFEKLLVGRSYEEVPDAVARICGICPVAYQISAVNALEDAMGVDPGPWARDMRTVMYCGEWIQSHCLHIHLLAAPDFFGFDSAIAMAREHGGVINRGLELQALGNDLMRLLGARSVHPVGVRVGGFYKAPTARQAAEMAARLRAAMPQAEALIAWAASIEVPEDNQAFVSVALRAADGYAIRQGRVVSSDGLDIDVHDYEAYFQEHQEPHSTALFSLLEGKPYLVGPLARLNLNGIPSAVAMQARLGVDKKAWPSSNMFNSIVARAVEVCFAIGEAARLLESYQVPDAPAVPVSPRAGVGCGASEAPRGLLWHRYEVDSKGHIVNARIVPPTSQNQARIHADLRTSLLAFGLEHDDDELRLHCEKVIRNYDPCISCATHFLKLTTERI